MCAHMACLLWSIDVVVIPDLADKATMGGVLNFVNANVFRSIFAALAVNLSLLPSGSRSVLFSTTTILSVVSSPTTRHSAV